MNFIHDINEKCATSETKRFAVVLVGNNKDVERIRRNLACSAIRVHNPSFVRLEKGGMKNVWF